MDNFDLVGKGRIHQKILLRRKVALSPSHLPMVDGMVFHIQQNKFSMKHIPQNLTNMKKVMANYKLMLSIEGTYMDVISLSLFCPL